MVVKRAVVCGYCMGVERAIKKTYQELEAHPERKILTLGPLIHNPITLKQLQERGVSVIKNPDEITHPEETTVIVRAHGVPPQMEQRIIATGAKIVDATCPKVHVSQKKAAQFEKDGYKVLIAGEPEHSEIIGILGYAPHAIVIKNLEEALQVAQSIQQQQGEQAKIMIMAQTTYSETNFEKIVNALKNICHNLKIENTICNATRERQEALYNLCKEVDAILVIGGKESANTQRLKSIAEAQGLPAWLIEDEQEIPEQIYEFPRVGITAGASTPKEIIDRVEVVLKAGSL
jgi:4-hydroxy-3-methylbut-2-enyl diphosphate reductase